MRGSQSGAICWWACWLSNAWVMMEPISSSTTGSDTPCAPRSSAPSLASPSSKAFSIFCKMMGTLSGSLSNSSASCTLDLNELSIDVLRGKPRSSPADAPALIVGVRSSDRHRPSVSRRRRSRPTTVGSPGPGSPSSGPSSISMLSLWEPLDRVLSGAELCSARAAAAASVASALSASPRRKRLPHSLALVAIDVRAPGSGKLP
mmetsp:Transcript_79617/g.206822  ORF Transcript_79617/g.206822 Transcript_79617/m.206822 type:complete len:204 (+) Transcript_79617:138-749(+)